MTVTKWRGLCTTTQPAPFHYNSIVPGGEIFLRCHALLGSAGFRFGG